MSLTVPVPVAWLSGLRFELTGAARILDDEFGSGDPGSDEHAAALLARAEQARELARGGGLS